MPKDVLVIEDDEQSPFVFAEMCRELGFHCLTANNGKEAIEMLVANASTIGVVLMDIHMPVFSGIDATMQIRSNPSDPPKNIPVIATTADICRHNPRRCPEHGFSSVLPKPVGYDRLSETLHHFAA